ncbi:transmembrane protein 158-like [Scleropages formosus]|uniref:Transmembrane protein 158-like n=1 Tax=Scleropages formosus TaxID=113540 RepID=A0A0P7WJE9_SCLFO|nr:transmembrane protein 158-like [Scleropages formosus]KPP61380.1 transmembrane protein 158-like [Scleropages formosus]
MSPRSCTLLLLALAAAALISTQSCRGWSDEDRALAAPVNSSGSRLEDLRVDLRYSKRSVHEDARLPEASLQPPCNVSVRRLMPTSLIAHWDRHVGFQCDVHVYTTNRGRALFCAAFNWVASPVVIEHLAVSGGQQQFRLCVGCGVARSARGAHGGSHATGDPLSFCCVEFALNELTEDSGWTLNRKPIESTLVACFMTLVIIVWSVAALIWPVPIIAGFLPNGMEQRRPR